MTFHPYSRVFLFVTGIVGAILCTNNLLLLFFWLLILLPLMILTGNAKSHFSFLLLVVLPMSVMLSFLFWIVLNHSADNFNSITQTILKLICYTTVVQVVLLIPSNQVYSTFKMWGMKGDTLVTFLGSYIVWVDVINRSDKILTARFARGFISERTFLAKLKQLPHLLIPLIIGIIRTATERSESWEQKKILYRIELLKTQKVKPNLFLNSGIVFIGIVWFCLNIYLRWK